MEIKLKGRELPRDEKGDVKFIQLSRSETMPDAPIAILQVFTPSEVVELVNRALYQLEYQVAAHRKRGMRIRQQEKALREELKKQGLDPKRAKVDNELKGE